MSRTVGTSNATPYATAPAVGAPGDTYFNTTTKILYISDGTNWLPVGGTPVGIEWAYNGADSDAIYPAGGIPQSIAGVQTDRILINMSPAWPNGTGGTNTHLCPLAGYWRISGNVAAGSGGWNNLMTAGILVRGGALIREKAQANSPYANMSFTADVYLGVGDSVSLFVYNGQTGAMTNGPNIRTITNPSSVDPTTPRLSAWLIR